VAVISVTITESTEEVVDGIPKTISLSTNIPATIFYTLDGTTPDTTSSVYVTPITLPTLPAPQLRIFATNGTDSSAIIEQDYGPDISFARLPHAAVTGLDINSQNSLGLFGSNTQDTAEAVYQNSGQAGITVLAPDLETFPSGRYDADGNPAALTNESLQSYKIIQSESNVNGETGYGIGTLVPVNKLPERDNNVPEESNRAQKLFNPRALVVYQDASTEDTTAPPQLNREFFSLEVPEKEKDGALLYNNGPNTATTTASFLKSYYNPRDNTITYYYRDSSTNRWLVSKQPYQLRDPNVGNLSNMVFGRETGNGFIFRWIPFARRVLT
jgi:hypothetical protein